jgi:hypothetical protein
MNAHTVPQGVIHEPAESQPVRPAPARWRAGADALRRNHLGELAAMCMDAAAPLALVASQLIYAGGPFVGTRAMHLARFLESEKSISSLAHYLATGEDDPAPSPGVARG